jgi:threonine dehydratase
VDDYRAAAERIGSYVRRTPVLRVLADGRPVTFKLEFLQVSGSFKIRGALNALLAHRAARGKPEAVVTASGGNHGLGVATAARWLGVAATVYVPVTVPEAKARRIAAAGADIVRYGHSYAAAEMEARHLAARDGLLYVHAYDDPAVTAGQGTIGLEILADLPECDVVAVPVGGGGLLAGVSGALGSVAAAADAMPRATVAVEPEGCPTLHAAVEAGGPVDVGAESVAASALGAGRAGRLALAAYRTGTVRLAMVSDKEILAARDRLWEDYRLAVEPAAATVFAAWLAGQVPGDYPCLVLSGANADWTP